MSFSGFPPGLTGFYHGLAADNSRAYWEANKAVWHSDVRTPLLALLDELAPEFGPLRMFRPHRDVRFAADKSPYKLWAGATSETRAVGGVGYYLSVSASGLVAGCGAMALARDQLQRFRSALADDRSGQAFADAVGTLAGRSLPVTPGAEPPLKRVPSGYAADHPRADFLRWKGAVIIREDAPGPWLHTTAALDRVRDLWRGARPLKDWLDAHVGASHEPTGRPPGGDRSGTEKHRTPSRA